MAGAGAKLFTSGSVLTADQVNTYLMDQAIMKFASTTARDAAFGGAGEPTLSEGMFAYTTDTNTLWFYDGSAWEVATIKPSENYAAGKNKIINGDFTINQRAFTSVTADGYGFDRWRYTPSGATGTYSPQTFSLGAAPVAGYEATNFARIDITTGNDNCAIQQRIESVRTFAGQTATVSFWAKGTNPTTEGGLYASLSQVFGTGGSPSASVTIVSPKFVLTANWTRYSFTLSVPSISGKTLGTTVGTDFLALIIGQGAGVSTDAWTLDIWGVQVESGSVASAFQTSTGSIQGELAACQRYFFVFNVAINGPSGFCDTTTAARACLTFPTTMRTNPTFTATAADFEVRRAGPSSSAGTAISATSRVDGSAIDLTVASGLTAGAGIIIAAVSGTKTMQFSAEL
jgi:hypothetical protein